ncbi:MAG TPA: ABC transporter permease [Gemmatimonadaceae bacterium]|jgi:predicted permease
MARLGKGRRQLTSSLFKASVEDEVDSEFAFHVEMRTQEYIARGMPEDAARARAIAKFGNIDSVNAECRTIGNSRERGMERSEYIHEFLHDVRFAIRQLIKTPAFAAVAIFTLALGIGATTAIFSAVEAVVLRAFPYPKSDRLVFAMTHWSFGNGNVSVGDFADWRRRSNSFSDMTAFQFRGVTLSNTQPAERVTIAAATASMFSMYGIRPELGRGFTVDEDAPGRTNVIVLSDGLWRRAFGGDTTIVGRTIPLDGQSFTVIGVMPRLFDPTNSQEEGWIPAGFTPQQLAFHDEHTLTVVGRLKEGVTINAAQREMTAIASRMSVEFPETNKTSSIALSSFSREIVGDYHDRMLVLLAAVTCVLLIACVNVANLLLARGSARGKELAIRTAIGAGRARIVRQLLTESVVLSTIATVFGLLLAWAGVHLLLRSAPADIPRLGDTRIDASVLAFAVGLTILSALTFGLLPALRIARGDLQRSLREGGRTSLASARDVVRAMLVATEVAVALTLLIGAGLLIRSAVYLNHVDPGFNPVGVLSARVALHSTASGAEEQASGLEAEQSFRRILDELKSRPGVQSAAIVSQVPAGPGASSNGLVPEGRPADLASAIDSRMHLVSPGYLTMMGIPLVEGRDINAQDVRGAMRAIVVSKAFAQAAWPSASAIGKRLRCCEGSPTDPAWKTVVGVAADVRGRGAAGEVSPEFYMPIAQMPFDAWRWTNRTMTLVARAKSGDALSLAPAMRSAVAAVDPGLPLYGVASMEDRLGRTLAEPRFHLALLATLGVVGVLLAAAGIYSVIAYFVSLRTHEIGVRMTLGATTRDVIRLLTLQGLRPVVIGVAVGLVGATWATRLLRGSLYGVGTTDSLTFVVVTAMLLAISLIAILIPARRATSVDPAMALRG